MDLFSTKAGCSNEIHLGSNDFIRSARTLEIILEMMLRNEIGLKSLMEAGFSTFGISTILASLRFGGNSPISSQAFLVWNNNQHYISSETA